MSNLNSTTWCKCNNRWWTSNNFKTATRLWQRPNWLNLSSNSQDSSKLQAKSKCSAQMKKTSCRHHSLTRLKQVQEYSNKKLASSMELMRLQHRRALWIRKWCPVVSRGAVQASELLQGLHDLAIETYRLRTSSSKSSLTWSSNLECRQTMSKKRSSSMCRL